MAFTPPTTFVAGTAWLGSALAENFKAARDYLNAEIVAGDYGPASFDTEQLSTPEPLLSWDDYNFLSGAHALSAMVSNDSTRRRYALGTLKSEDITQQIIHQQIPGASVRVWMDAPGDLWIEGYGAVRVGQFDSSAVRAYLAKTIPTPHTVDSRFYLELDGAVIANTRCYCFAESGGTPSAQSIANAVTNLSDGAGARRPLYMFWVATNLAAGWHTIRLVVDVRSEYLYVGEDSWQWEVLSDCGLTTYTGTDYLSPD